MISCYKQVKVPQSSFRCVVDLHARSKAGGLKLLEAALEGMNYELLPELGGCNWVKKYLPLNPEDSEEVPIGIHCQKYRRDPSLGRRGFWRLRVYLIEDRWYDLTVVQHPRHFDVFKPKKS